MSLHPAHIEPHVARAPTPEPARGSKRERGRHVKSTCGAKRRENKLSLSWTGRVTKNFPSRHAECDSSCSSVALVHRENGRRSVASRAPSRALQLVSRKIEEGAGGTCGTRRAKAKRCAKRDVHEKLADDSSDVSDRTTTLQADNIRFWPWMQCPIPFDLNRKSKARAEKKTLRN